MRRRQVERGADDGSIRPPVIELVEVWDERTLGERRQSLVRRQIQLLAHARAELGTGRQLIHDRQCRASRRADQRCHNRPLASAW
jgi:hypothetical protein